MAHRTENSRSITADGLARLLARLHSDAEQAGLEYVRLRRSLVKFFDWRGAWSPEECADEALDRLARRLEEKTSVGDVHDYAYGIARMLLLEQRRRPRFSSIDENPERAAVSDTSPGADSERLRDCFDRCLDDIPADGRSLVVEYYEGERHVKISNRRRLAAAFGLSDNALRSRVQRLRERLEQCVHGCVSEAE